MISSLERWIVFVLEPRTDIINIPTMIKQVYMKNINLLVIVEFGYWILLIWGIIINNDIIINKIKTLEYVTKDVKLAIF